MPGHGPSGPRPRTVYSSAESTTAGTPHGDWRPDWCQPNRRSESGWDVTGWSMTQRLYYNIVSISCLHALFSHHWWYIYIYTRVLGPCFVAEGPAERNSFGWSCSYVMPKVPFMKLRYYSISEDEGSNRLKDRMTFWSIRVWVIIVNFYEGHDCNSSQAVSCAYK
jgi:hypothetical protein